MVIKVGVLATHPIQYQAPWFRLLAACSEIDLTVYYCLIPDDREQGRDFGVAFRWDIPLLDGYRFEVLENIAGSPTPSQFEGCDTPGIDTVVRHGAFDAFIVNGWQVKSCIQLLWSCRRHGVPCIVRGESNDLRPRPLWKELVHRVLLSQFAACLFIGEGNKRFYLRNGVSLDKLFFAPYCVDNDRFAENVARLQGDRCVIRSSWGIPENAVTFLFCGKFIKKKRPMDILHSLVHLLRSGDLPGAIHLLMIGTGELLESCKAFAAGHGLPVTFAGFLNQSEIPRAYAVSDCLILPSDHGETWGLVVNEGMACGLPAIVSNEVGCHPDLIAPGETGLVFPTGDVEALASCMGAVASDVSRLGKMKCAARERISLFTYQEVLRGTLAALEYVKKRG